MTPARSPREAGGDDLRHALGRHGERLAAAFLRGAGLTVLARNLRTALGEIDVLARDRGRVLVAVEVKTRRHHPAAERCVTPAAHRRLASALVAVARVQRPRPRWLRVDVVAVRVDDAGPPEVRHFPGLPWPPPP